MARYGSQELVTDLDGAAHRVARRTANRRVADGADPKGDAQGLVELRCECTRADCERSVRVPLYVYRRMLDSRDQYLLQAGHHAFDQYRTIISIGLMRIEEKA
jgi:hypothetical protein